MYVNFEQLLSANLTMTDLGYLLMIRQKEEMAEAIPEEALDRYKRCLYIERMKNGRYKLTPRGGSLLSLIETPGLTPEIEGIRDRLIGIYADAGKETGTVKEVERRLTWLVANTNFKEKPICDAVLSHLDTSREYAMRLDNLIWKPSNVYSVHMSLAESKLFDIIIKRYGMVSDPYLRESKNKVMSWLFAVSRLPDPPRRMSEDLTFTGDVKADAMRIAMIKDELGRRLR